MPAISLTLSPSDSLTAYLLPFSIFTIILQTGTHIFEVLALRKKAHKDPKVMEYIEIHTQAMKKYFDRDFEECVKLLDRNLETNKRDKVRRLGGGLCATWLYLCTD